MEPGTLQARIFHFFKNAQQATRGFDIHVAAPFDNGFV
jgi:hypothetical protein